MRIQPTALFKINNLGLSREFEVIKKGYSEKNTLSSVEKLQYGLIGTFCFLQFSVSQLFLLLKKISTLLREKWKDPEKFRNAFQENPLKVLEDICFLLEVRPNLVKDILKNIAEDWKEHPENYFLYNRESANKNDFKAKKMRNELIALVEDVFRKLILTPKEYALLELLAGTNELSEKNLNLYQHIEESEIYLHMEEANKSIRKTIFFWELCCDYICEKELQQQKEESFGIFIEKIICENYLIKLRFETTRKNILLVLKDMCMYMTTDEEKGRCIKDYMPEIHRLLTKIGNVLSDEKYRQTIEEILLMLFPIIAPLPQKGPPVVM